MRKWILIALAAVLVLTLPLLALGAAASAVEQTVAAIVPPLLLQGQRETLLAMPTEDSGGTWEDGEWTPEVYAVYAGTDETDTALSRAVLAQTRRWSNTRSPYRTGYGGRCEAWVYDVYKGAGLQSRPSCCAHNHSLYANGSGPIPKGALIFSGIIPGTGRVYENGHRSAGYCNVCNSWAGHVAIYIGDGKVAGSQIPYIQSLDSWMAVYGYGGWSTY